MITLERVSKVFTSRGQTVRAVDDVSFEVGRAGARYTDTIVCGKAGLSDA